jgi:hypothetical protein
VWDEARVETSMKSIGDGMPAPVLEGKIDSVSFDEESLVKNYRKSEDVMIFDCF